MGLEGFYCTITYMWSTLQLYSIYLTLWISLDSPTLGVCSLPYHLHTLLHSPPLSPLIPTLIPSGVSSFLTMGNQASSNHTHSNHTRRSSSRLTHSTAAASLSSFNTRPSATRSQLPPTDSPRILPPAHKQTVTAQQLPPRRRKSLEFPDLEPSCTSTASVPPSAVLPDHFSTLSDHGPNKLPDQDLAQFQLKLPNKGRKSPALRSNTASFSSSSTSAGALTGIEAMRLDSGDDFVPHHDSSSQPTQSIFINNKATVDPGEPPEAGSSEHPDSEHPFGCTLPATPTPLQPDSDLFESSGTFPPVFPPPGVSPVVSMAPLQQPVETVFPPLPPAIVQPFPPPLAELDSADAPLPNESIALTTAVSETVAAATAVVQAAPALDIGAGPDGVPTLITWKEPANEVYVTGTFSKWRQQIKLRKPLTKYVRT